MIYKFEFNSKEEKYEIEKNNSDKYLIEEQYLIEGNFLVYTDELSEIEKIKTEQEQQNEEILVNMLANTEMFEMILSMMPTALSIDGKNTKNSGGSSMIEVYTTLIIKNVKTIEDVPLVIREQVIERLKQLEVPVK